MPVSQGRRHKRLEAEEVEGQREAERRKGMSCRGCLTHPALCRPWDCPDASASGRNGYILSKILTKYHGRRNKGPESAISREEVCEAEKEKGCFRAYLGRVDRKDSQNSRRISENCLPSASTLDRQRLNAK